MNEIMSLLVSAFLAVTIENTIFARALGTSTMVIAAKTKTQFWGFAISILMISTFSGMLTYVADTKLLSHDRDYLYMPIIYVMIVGLVYIFLLLILWKFAPNFFLQIKKFIHLSAFNCAVLGGLMLCSHNVSTFWGYVGFSIGTAGGFMFAAYMLSVVYDKLYSEKVPDSFRGYPAILIYVGILAMAFFGFSGYQISI